MARSTLPSAPIAGLSPGVQSQGIWTGRRQLFVRFAGEAETAVLYSSEMLAKQLERATAPGTKIVIHPAPAGEKSPLDRRYATLLEQATMIHRDVVLQFRIPGPVG